MHFTWEISIGQIIVSVPIFSVLYILVKMQAMLLRFRIEHEDLMSDWCARQVPPRKLMDLPTRRKVWW